MLGDLLVKIWLLGKLTTYYYCYHYYPIQRSCISGFQRGVLQKCYELCKNPEIVAFHKYVVSSQMKSHMESNGFAMKDSTRKCIRNNLEKECKEINFINYNNSVYIYPSSLKTEEVNFKKYQKQADEAVKLKDKLVSKNDPLSSCGKIIREEISNMKDKLPWTPQPDDQTPDKFEIPANLDTFLTILFCDNKKASLVEFQDWSIVLLKTWFMLHLTEDLNCQSQYCSPR